MSQLQWALASPFFTPQRKGQKTSCLKVTKNLILNMLNPG